ncbi:hypothetical protein GOC00_08475 [Sinorhizobium meliloti]|nr:hypothetical protein [Sinorhizobium meliloti]MDX0000560.1 hypothetical protein [Sinorhizobium meliloti]MDX0075275.1 hypothetical protein [Sinorhizobium meliloti]MDX0210175.1 hypothetical protein [Sinorhizobium meliloti]MDX0353822.1 hypothetical protein [Sinorhizobium meliloti]
MPKVDTVSKNYYAPLGLMDTIGGLLFWAISILSIVTLLIDKATYPQVNTALQIVFLIGAILFFVHGQFQNIYLFPRAEDARRQEALSNSFNVTLTHEETVGYYNNDQTNPLRRLAANSMESVYFTRSILRKMLRSQRITTLLYVVVWIAAFAYPSTDLEVIGVAAQAIFSGEIIGRLVRMEWLRMRCEHLFNDFNRLFNGGKGATKPITQAQIIEFFTYYETTKSTAAILLSTKIFNEQNASLTAEWDRIRTRLGI